MDVAPHMLLLEQRGMARESHQTTAMEELAQRGAREWVRHLSELKGLRYATLAKRAGLSTSTVSRPMQEEPAGILTRETIERLAQHFGVPAPQRLLESLPHGRVRKSTGRTVANLIRLPVPPAGPNDVPVWGALPSLRPNFFYLNRTPLDYAKRPPGGAGNAGLACIRMPDESMEPWRMTGEPVYLDPYRPIALGNHALIEVMEERDPNGVPFAFIARNTREGWFLHGPRTTLNLKGLRIVERFRVLEWVELLA